MSVPPLLEVEDLRAYFFLPESTVKAVDGASFQIRKGEIVGLAGESGCGKTTAGRSIVRAIDPSAGEVHFYSDDGHIVNYASLTRKELNDQCVEAYGSVVDYLNRNDASSLIDWLLS